MHFNTARLPNSDVLARYDICENKHHNNPESVAANVKNLHSRGRQRSEVYDFIHSAGPQGLSMKEVARLMGVEFNRIAGRGSELKASGLVEKTGEVREGSAVLRAT
jgi:hypothetical protein